MDGVRLGVTYFATDRSWDVRDVARATEARGLYALLLPEHTNIPVSRATPYPGGGDPLPDEYTRTVDPFVALSMAAAVTERLVVGTGICLLAQRDPVVTAKAAATLANLSGGRFLFGVGYGWNVEELANHGIAFADRRAVVDERVAAIRRLWADDPAEHSSPHVQLTSTWVRPHPVAPIPVLIGGVGGPRLFASIAAVADGWLPIGGGGLRDSIPRLRDAFDAAGRDPDTARVVLGGTVPDAGKLEYWAGLGIREVVAQLPHGGRDEILPVLDHYASLVS